MNAQAQCEVGRANARRRRVPPPPPPHRASSTTTTCAPAGVLCARNEFCGLDFGTMAQTGIAAKPGAGLRARAKVTAWFAGSQPEYRL